MTRTKDKDGNTILTFKKKKRETSKIMLGAVMVLYFLGAVFGGYMVFTMCEGLEALLVYIGSPTTAAIGFYSWKAKNENIRKIGKNFVDDDVKGDEVNG